MSGYSKIIGYRYLSDHFIRFDFIFGGKQAYLFEWRTKIYEPSTHFRFKPEIIGFRFKMTNMLGLWLFLG